MRSILSIYNKSNKTSSQGTPMPSEVVYANHVVDAKVYEDEPEYNEEIKVYEDEPEYNEDQEIDTGVYEVEPEVCEDEIKDYEDDAEDYKKDDVIIYENDESECKYEVDCIPLFNTVNTNPKNFLFNKTITFAKLKPQFGDETKTNFNVFDDPILSKLRQDLNDKKDDSIKALKEVHSGNNIFDKYAKFEQSIPELNPPETNIIVNEISSSSDTKNICGKNYIEIEPLNTNYINDFVDTHQEKRIKDIYIKPSTTQNMANKIVDERVSINLPQKINTKEIQEKMKQHTSNIKKIDENKYTIQPMVNYKILNKVNPGEIQEKIYQHESNVKKIEKNKYTIQPMINYRIPTKVNPVEAIENMQKYGTNNTCEIGINCDKKVKDDSSSLLSMLEKFGSNSSETKNDTFNPYNIDEYDYESKYTPVSNAYHDNIFRLVMIYFNNMYLSRAYDVIKGCVHSSSIYFTYNQKLVLMDAIIECIRQSKSWSNNTENKTTFCDIFDLFIKDFEISSKITPLRYAYKLALVAAVELKSNNMWIIKYILKQHPELDASILNYISEENELSYKLIVKYLEKTGIKIPPKEAIAPKEASKEPKETHKEAQSFTQSEQKVEKSQPVVSPQQQINTSENNLFKFEINGKTIKLETDRGTDLTFTVRSRDMKNNQTCVIEVY